MPERSIESLIANRPYRSIGDFINRSGVGKVESETLTMVGALDGFGYPRPALLLAILGRNGDRAARRLEQRQQDASHYRPYEQGVKNTVQR